MHVTIYKHISIYNTQLFFSQKKRTVSTHISLWLTNDHKINTVDSLEAVATQVTASSRWSLLSLVSSKYNP